MFVFEMLMLPDKGKEQSNTAFPSELRTMIELEMVMPPNEGEEQSFPHGQRLSR